MLVQIVQMHLVFHSTADHAGMINWGLQCVPCYMDYTRDRHNNVNIVLCSIHPQDWTRGFIRYMPFPYYPASVVNFQLHGGMVSHMQVLATPSSTVHKTKYLDPYH